MVFVKNDQNTMFTTIKCSCDISNIYQFYSDEIQTSQSYQMPEQWHCGIIKTAIVL